MGKYFDRDTKVAYVEQINSGKMTVTEAVNELGCSRSAIYSWIKKLSEDGEHGLPGSEQWNQDFIIITIKVYVAVSIFSLNETEDVLLAY